MLPDFIVQNENMVRKLSGSFYGVPREDLMQAGFLGLVKAYKNFDASFNVKFSTYAYPFIYGEMYEAATGNRPIRIKKPEMRIYKSVMHGKELLEAKYNRSVSYEETCQHLNIDYQTFISILNSLSDFVSVEDTELHLTKNNHIDDLILLKEALNELSPEEKEVIERRYMHDYSQDETAKVMGLSQVKVSRIEKKSKEKMKNFVAS